MRWWRSLSMFERCKKVMPFNLKFQFPPFFAEPRCRPGDAFGGEGSPCCSSGKRCGVGDGICRNEGDCEKGLVCRRNRASRTCIVRLDKEHQDDSCCTYKGAVSISMPVLFHALVAQNCLSLYSISFRSGFIGNFFIFEHT